MQPRGLRGGGSGWLVRLAAVGAALLSAGAVFDLLRLSAAKRGWCGPRVSARAVEVDGMRGFLLEAGSGATTVVLASPLILARSYLPLVQVLATQGRTIVVELPGSGSGSRLSQPLSSARAAEWVSALLEQLELASATIIGHSLGGAVALQVRSPRVTRLVLADSVGARRKRGTLRVVLARLADAVKEPLLGLRCWWHFLHNAVVHPRSLVYQISVGANAELLALARDVRIPTVLAWGRWDRTMPSDCAFRLQACIPGARVVIGPGSHDWLITRAHSFAQLVLPESSPSPKSSSTLPPTRPCENT